MRKPEGYRIDAPGDLIQADTVQLRFANSEIRHQYSARDAISRWDCGRAFRRASSFTASLFLDYMEKKFPFPIRAIQIDGGSEFKKHFEAACRDRGIRLFIIPPRSPKLQGYADMRRGRTGHIGRSFMKSKTSRPRSKVIIASWRIGTKHKTTSAHISP
jgi:hypothetical protein